MAGQFACAGASLAQVTASESRNPTWVCATGAWGQAAGDRGRDRAPVPASQLFPDCRPVLSPWDLFPHRPSPLRVAPSSRRDCRSPRTLTALWRAPLSWTRFHSHVSCCSLVDQSSLRSSRDSCGWSVWTGHALSGLSPAAPRPPARVQPSSALTVTPAGPLSRGQQASLTALPTRVGASVLGLGLASLFADRVSANVSAC